MQIPEFFKQKRIWPEFSLYILCVVLSVLILICTLQLWNADLTIPFSYEGDGLQSGMLIKGLIDNPWWSRNDFLGMPFGQENFDLPVMDNLNSSIMKVLGLFFPDYAVTMNLFFLLTFPLTSLTSLYLFRKLGAAPGPAIVGSMLFTFIPAHFFRGEPHFPYAAYFLLPLVVLVLIWIYEAKPVIYNRETKKMDLLNRYTVTSVLVCSLMGFQNIYHLYFACFFLFVLSILALIKSRDLRCVIPGVVLIVLMSSFFLLSVSPVLLYQQASGPNPIALMRSPMESEYYGLKIIQMVLPIPGHRIPLLAAINARYSASAPSVNENAMAALGLIGTAGFVLLLLWIIFNAENIIFPSLERVRKKLNCLSVLNISGILLGTIGGFGTLVAYLFFDGIRAYNRISIFIALFSITAIVLILTAIRTEYVTTRNRQVLFFTALCLILAVGLYDQTSPAFVGDYHSTKKIYTSHQNFFSTIEERMSPGSMVYQYPYVQYLGWTNTPREFIPYAISYEGALPYLHTKSLRWSYGSMVNRKGDLWNRKLVVLPLNDQIDRLSYAGFSGILVDTGGYSNSTGNITMSLRDLLQVDPLISSDGRYYFFDIKGYNSRLKDGMSEETWNEKKIATLEPLIIRWTGGFSVLEGSPDANLRWCGPTGELHLINSASRNRTISFETTFGTGYPERSELLISSSDFREVLDLNDTGKKYRGTLTLPPGETVVSFSSNARRVEAPGEMRNLAFYLRNFRFDDNFVIDTP